MTEEQKNKNIRYLKENFIDVTNESETLAYPLFIPSCHNRKPSLLDNLDQFLDTQIFVFIYEHEVDMYEWLDKPNVKKVVVPKSYITIQKMRVFMQQYAIDNGISKCWVSDDDISHIMLINKTIKTTLARGMRVLEKYSEDRNWPMTSFYFNEMGAKFWDGTLEVPGVCGNLVLFDWDLLEDIKYTGDVTVGEDIEFLIECFKAGLSPMVVRWGLHVPYSVPGAKNSIASKEDLPWVYCMNLYKKYGDYLRIKLSKNTQKVSYYPNIKNITKNSRPSWDNSLLEICKQNDVEKFKEYLREAYKKKDEKAAVPGMAKLFNSGKSN